MSKTVNPSEDFHWHDGLLLGYSPMDSTHEEFVHCVAAMQAASDEQLPSALAAFVAHAERHFGEEDRWMTETDFPARDCHIQEHAEVMKSVRMAQDRLAQGDNTVCRRLADELVRWFPGHASYLDSALAHWMCKARFGGKPVVIRRSAGRSTVDKR